MNLNFKVERVDLNESTNSFQPLPEGDYHFIIDECRPSKYGTGFTYVCVVLEGPKTGRKFFYDLNTESPNEKSRTYCINALSRLCAACDFNPEEFVDSDQLIGYEFIGHLKIYEWNGSPKNKMSWVRKPDLSNKQNAHAQASNVEKNDFNIPF